MDLYYIIAAKAAGFFEALKPEFQTYKNVLANAKILAETLKIMDLKFILVEQTHI